MLPCEDLLNDLSDAQPYNRYQKDLETKSKAETSKSAMMEEKKEADEAQHKRDLELEVNRLRKKYEK